MTLLPVGTRPSVRLVLRRDRLRLTLWFGLTALLLAAEMRLMVATSPPPRSGGPSPRSPTPPRPRSSCSDP